MSKPLGFASLLLAATCLSPAHGQIAPEAGTSPGAPRFGVATVTRYRTGAVITARNGAVKNINAMVAAPLECAEQTVRVIEEDVNQSVQGFDYRLLPGGGARQMLIHIPYLRGGEEGRAVITYEVVTHAILPPEDPSVLQAPHRRDREGRRYLGPSPFIEVNHRKIRKALAAAIKALAEEESAEDAEEADPDDAESTDAEQTSNAAGDAPASDTASDAADDGSTDDAAAAEGEAKSSDEATDEDEAAAEPTTWRRVEAIYDYVIDHVEYEEGVDKSAVQVLGEGVGDCQARGALFVAMCRTDKIPARLVWVHDHQYAEFYLADEQGEGHWYPVETAGTPAFGEMRIARVILQKGDNFRVPERPRERLRYATDFLTGLPTPGGGKPRVKYIREPL